MERDSMSKGSRMKYHHFCMILMCICSAILIQCDRHGEEGSPLRCKPQSFSKMLHGGQPARAPGGLPFCKQYSGCTCCDRRHAESIGLRLQSALDVLSPACFEITSQIACRPCDPEVGVGQKEKVCADTCAQWYSACKEDFFDFHPLTEELIPCGGSALVCSRLKDLVADGADMCQKASLPVSDKAQQELQPCFDASVPPPLASCRDVMVAGDGIQEWSIGKEGKLLICGLFATFGLLLWWAGSYSRSVTVVPVAATPQQSAGLAAAQRVRDASHTQKPLHRQI